MCHASLANRPSELARCRAGQLSSSGRPLAETDVFDVTVGILRELRDARRLFVVLLPPFTVLFEIDRDAYKPLPTALSESDFWDATQDVGQALLAILEDEVEYFVQRRTRGDNALPAATWFARVELVRDALWTPELEARYQLKVSSKAPAFAGIDWDIKVKVEDASLGSIDLPYTTCKIRLQREFSDSPFTVISGRVFDSIQVNLTLDEVEHLIKVLGVVRERLSALEPQEA
jgi:hypothetical protein